MTALALRTAAHVNAVSQVHARVTSDMWAPIWPEVNTDGAPPRSGTVTNGVHLTSWVAHETGRLFDQHLGDDWQSRQDEPELWDRIYDIPDDELWAARQALRAYLFAFIRERARESDGPKSGSARDVSSREARC